MSNLNLPEWVDQNEYPFQPKTMDTVAGKLSYLDEGTGNAIVFLHGNPTWSFLYRKAVLGLRKKFRCIVPDLIGFGLSDKPIAWSYKAKDQADIIEAFLEKLNLKDITVVVGDWGGPLGLSYAVRHPQRVKSIIVTNTWCWPLNASLYYQMFSKIVGGPIGRCLIKTRNLFARDIVKMAFGDRGKLTEAIHRHYLAPLAAVSSRQGSAVFPREIIAASDWLSELWSARESFKPKIKSIIWGQKDIAFRPRELSVWRKLCPSAKLLVLPGVGHFVAEEAPETLINEIIALSDR